jgi:hypothetical protein
MKGAVGIRNRYFSSFPVLVVGLHVEIETYLMSSLELVNWIVLCILVDQFHWEQGFVFPLQRSTSLFRFLT